MEAIVPKKKIEEVEAQKCKASSMKQNMSYFDIIKNLPSLLGITPGE
jgi:hypothetical protein